MIPGIDVSLWDPVVDWVNHPWKYTFIKISDGIIEDPIYKFQWHAARNHVYRSAYHFFRPLVNWKLAADKMLFLLDREGHGELPPVLDLEVTNNVSNAAINEYGLEWMHYVNKEIGRKPIVYTSKGFSDYIGMFRYPDWADFPLWEAAYPWDKIAWNWTEAQRAETIHNITLGNYEPTPVVTARPWEDVGRRWSFWQFTGKALPEHIPGYPLGDKLAVDVNLYRHGLQELIFQFNLKPLQGDDNMSSKPITWTAVLRSGQSSNLRTGPGVQYGNVEPTITAGVAGLEYRGTGVKLVGTQDNYYWGEVVSIGGQPKQGFIAFTTSFGNVTWLETPTDPDPEPEPTTKKAVGTRVFYNDDTHDDIGTVQQ
jgi:GH25 family lysozyme M1 (1,4-beta-N-acetylmuramidase)